MPVEISGFGDQKFEVKPILDLGTRLHELEISLPDRVHNHRITSFETMYELFDSLKALLKRAELADAFALIEQELEDLQKAYQDFVIKSFQNPVVCRDLAQLMKEAFNISEIKSLCDELGVPYEDRLETTNQGELSRWLVDYCVRRSRTVKLFQTCQSERKEQNWLAVLPGTDVILVSKWWEVQKTLQKAVEEELRNRIIITLPPPPPVKDQLNSIRTLFLSSSRDYFIQLPDMAQAFFQEAANCFACEQFSAATVQAWRGAHLTLIDYCRRANMLNEDSALRKLFTISILEGRKLDWQWLVDNIPVVNWKNDHDPDRRARSRAAESMEKYYSAFRLDSQIEKAEAWDLIKDAVVLSSFLIQDWLRARRRFIVEVNGDLSSDVLVALYLLDRYGEGVGWVTFTDTSTSTSLVVNGEPVPIVNDGWPITKGASKHFNLPLSTTNLDILRPPSMNMTNIEAFLNNLYPDMVNVENSNSLKKLELVNKDWEIFRSEKINLRSQPILTTENL